MPIVDNFVFDVDSETIMRSIRDINGILDSPFNFKQNTGIVEPSGELIFYIHFTKQKSKISVFW